MQTIKMYGWNAGLQKVSLSLLQVDLLGISLGEAKSNVDRILDGRTVRIEGVKSDLAKLFIERAKAIGVKCSLE